MIKDGDRREGLTDVMSERRSSIDPILFLSAFPVEKREKRKRGRRLK